MAHAGTLGLPANPLDDLIDRLGGKQHVSELTGRSLQVVRDPSAASPGARRSSGSRAGAFTIARRSEGSSGKVNLHEKDLFLKGKKLVAVISDAASTGISLHANARFANTRQRVQITLELPWSADKAIQQFGRTHRANQVTPPQYVLLTSTLAVEQRFASAVAARMAVMGALTKGDRRAAAGTDLSSMDLSGRHTKEAVRQLLSVRCGVPAGVPRRSPPQTLRPPRPPNTQALAAGAAPRGVPKKLRAVFEDEGTVRALQLALADVGLGEMDTAGKFRVDEGAKAASVERFLNRLLGVHVSDQAALFDAFAALHEKIARAARQENRAGGQAAIPEINGRVRIEERRTVYTSQDGADKAEYLLLSRDRGLSWADVLAKHAGACAATPKKKRPRSDAKAPGFHAGKTLYGGLTLVMWCEWSGSSVFCYRPNSGGPKVLRGDDAQELVERYRAVDAAAAEPLWADLFDRTETGCMHLNCSGGPGCRVGTRSVRTHFVMGSVLSLWNELSMSGNPRVTRVVADGLDGAAAAAAAAGGGEMRFIGVEVKNDALAAMEDRFAAREKRDATAAAKQGGGAAAAQQQQQQQQQPHGPEGGEVPPPGKDAMARLERAIEKLGKAKVKRAKAKEDALKDGEDFA